MFEVARVIRRGWWRDRVVLRALYDVNEQRLRLGCDFMGNPGVSHEYMRVPQGNEFEVSLPHALSQQAGALKLEQMANLRGFKHLWRKADEKEHHVF